MQLTWLGIAIAATVAYHIVMKLTPAGVNPYLSLAVTYAVVTVAFAAVYVALPGPAPIVANEASSAARSPLALSNSCLASSSCLRATTPSPSSFSARR